MTLLSPERPTGLSPLPEPATPLTQPASGSTHPAGPESTTPALPEAVRLQLLVVWDQLVLVATILWLLTRLAGLALGRLVDWFAADPRRTRVALAGICLAGAVGAVIGLTAGMVLTGCWTAVRSIVLDDLS